jgi:hypothetical protein
MNAPTIPSVTRSNVHSWTNLTIDPPRTDGPQMGDCVEYWQGEAAPRDPFCGFVTLVGPNARISIGGLLPSLMSVHSIDGAIPHDDLSSKGKWPKQYRYRPSQQTIRLRQAESEVAALRVLAADLKTQMAEIKSQFAELTAKKTGNLPK